jgi:hypothetical protein
MVSRLVALMLLVGGCSSRPAVDDAAAKYPDLRTLWSQSITRTCGPNSGVCHDNRQFPDLQTVSGLLSTVNARCNQLRDDPSTLDDLCEPAGDQFQLGAFSTRIGNVQATATTLTLTLKDPLPDGAGGDAAIVRAMPGLDPVTLAIPAAALAPVSSGATSVTLSVSALPATLTAFLAPGRHQPGDSTVVQLGDPNGNGIFGADFDGALVKPGRPMQSYLFLRLLAPQASGPQMPIANAQYWDGADDVRAVWCWISRMSADGANADGPIDWAGCNLSAMPSATRQRGESGTFASVFGDILQPTCSACHQSTFALGDPQASHDVLVGLSGDRPTESTLPWVMPGDPAHSYLFLKVSGDPSIRGDRMPQGGQLAGWQLESIETWIRQGADAN